MISRKPQTVLYDNNKKINKSARIGSRYLKEDEFNELEKMDTSKYLIQQLFDFSFDAIILVSESGIISDSNTSAHNLTGYCKEELLGLNIDSLFQDENKEPLTNTELLQVETKLRKKNGEKITAIVRSKFQNDHSTLVIIKDKSEVESLKIKADETNRFTSAFLANLSHEIRTPLNAIAGFAELLRFTDLDAETRNQYIEIINVNIQQLLTVIDDIIDISKIESGQITLAKEKVCINKIIDSIIDKYTNLASEKNLQLILEHNIDEEIYTDTDGSRLKQILSCLLNNALKFTQEGTITVSWNLKNDFIEFKVADTGIGIHKEHFKLIFERFKQVETGMSRNYGGTGLGLALSKTLVDKLGGKIWVESEPGKGSHFYFTVPYIGNKEDEIQPVQPSSAGMNKYDWRNKTILVAEDEEYNYFYVYELLNRTNVKLLRARDGAEAIDICKKNPNIDLALMDIKMRDIDGYEATKIIKSFRPSLPIIAQTAYAMADDRQKALKAGFDDYISKPIKKENLLNIILSGFMKSEQ